jgi:alkaline phosphatase
MKSRSSSLLGLLLLLISSTEMVAADWLYDLQTAAVKSKRADWGYWGADPKSYSSWDSHSNRLIPAYSFGIDLKPVKGDASPYRSVEKIKALYGVVPRGTFNPDAEYFDQSGIHRIQEIAVKSGKKRIILVVFDGMDWQTTWAAAIYKSKKVGYREGRGAGLHFQDYRGTTTDYGYFVSSPHNTNTNTEVDSQTVPVPGGVRKGGYAARVGGPFPWSTPIDRLYPIGNSIEFPHVYTDSAASASSLTAGIKTYNGAVNADVAGKYVVPIAQRLQQEGWAIGVVSSVPISHATPACAYANNVHRNDYQDISRDLLGLPSIAHPTPALPGVDVLIGAGHGITINADANQGDNFEVGNRYLAPSTEKTVQEDQRYELAFRTSGKNGTKLLADATARAIKSRKRLFGFFGCREKHLPFQTANGDFNPPLNVAATDIVPLLPIAEKYTPEDIAENPTLADMTSSALQILSQKSDRFWLMVEAGDVDWANHRNNIDNSVGAVLSGDAAFKTITDWVETNGGWADTAVILTADHGHYLTLKKPEALIPKP